MSCTPDGMYQACTANGNADGYYVDTVGVVHGCPMGTFNFAGSSSTGGCPSCMAQPNCATSAVACLSVEITGTVTSTYGLWQYRACLSATAGYHVYSSDVDARFNLPGVVMPCFQPEIAVVTVTAVQHAARRLVSATVLAVQVGQQISVTTMVWPCECTGNYTVAALDLANSAIVVFEDVPATSNPSNCRLSRPEIGTEQAHCRTSASACISPSATIVVDDVYVGIAKDMLAWRTVRACLMPETGYFQDTAGVVAGAYRADTAELLPARLIMSAVGDARSFSVTLREGEGIVYTISLPSKPTHGVTIGIRGWHAGAAGLEMNCSKLIFQPSNWEIDQHVLVSIPCVYTSAFYTCIPCLTFTAFT